MTMPSTARDPLPPEATASGERRDQAALWRAALLTGVITSTVSTLGIVIGSPRIGRGVALSFMEVGMVLRRDANVRTTPGVWEVVAGLVVHQGADLLWATLFFGALARWTTRLQPRALLAVAPFWALLTAATEYFAILPWLQPLLIMQTPFWVALLVHTSSAAAYPAYYLARRWLRAPRAGIHLTFGRRWMAAIGGLLMLLVLLEGAGAAGIEPRWPLADAAGTAFDQAFLRQMAWHHASGITLAQLAADKAQRDDLRTIGRLMVAEERSERDTMLRWWRVWFGGELPPPTPEEMAAMPGMPPQAALDDLARLTGPAFDARIITLLTQHHESGIALADAAWSKGGDPRIRLFADQLRHPMRLQNARLRALLAA